MADRKEWELTDEERTEIRAWYCGQGSISLHSRNIFCLADAFAYKGARKALEWAAFGPCRDEREVGQAEKTIIRELSDG